MCGIVAILLNEARTPAALAAKADPSMVAKTLVLGLERLEYRGYDSAGVALLDQSENSGAALRVVKRQGKVRILKDAIASDLTGSAPSSGARVVCGIAHTRWATHGVPSDINAHPHTSMDGDLAVVHNGIIENHGVLREHLKKEGYVFKSETDTEILAHLIRHVQKWDPHLSLEGAVSLALSQVNGAFGIAVVDTKFPGVLVGARRGSPLLLGVGDFGLALASDAAALVGCVSRVVYLEEDDMVVCRSTGDYEITNLQHRPATSPTAKSASGPKTHGFYPSDTEIPLHANAAANSSASQLDRHIERAAKKARLGNPEQVTRELHVLELSLEKIEKGGYKHFMMKEIMEQPNVLRDAMRGRVTADHQVRLGGLVDHMERIKKARRIIITACGTSWHSGLVGEHFIESLAKVPVEVEYASEFRYRNPIIYPDDVVIVMSQSGETADTLEAVRIAKSHGALTIGMVNVVGSSIARATDCGVYLHVGPEIGVASTKAFTGQIMVLALFALRLAVELNRVSPERATEIVQALQAVPGAVEQCLTPEKLQHILEISRVYRYASNFLFLGRGPNHPVALEGALKLKEISYVHAEGYPAAELKHGPIALIDRQMPVVVIAPRFDPTYEKVKSSIEEVVARSGNVVAITDEGNHELDSIAEFVIRVPAVDEFVSPFLTVIPLQFLAYHIASLRGCAIDQPRNLAKSVTVE